MELWLGAGYAGGSANRPVSKNVQSAVVKQTMISGAGGLGYRLFLYKGFYSVFLLGGGFMYGTMQIDYSSLPVKPVDPANQQAVSTQTFDSSAPVASADFRFGYDILRNVALEVGLGYTEYFYVDHASGLLSGRVGLGISF